MRRHTAAVGLLIPALVLVMGARCADTTPDEVSGRERLDRIEQRMQRYGLDRASEDFADNPFCRAHPTNAICMQLWAERYAPE